MKESQMMWHEAKQKFKDFVSSQVKSGIPLEQMMVSFSGGKDSTLILELVEACGYKNKIKVVFFDTLMEYQATYDFIKHKQTQGWDIVWTKPNKPAPLIYRDYGVPVNSKHASEMINRLQKHNFDFVNDTDKEFDELLIKYPKCKSALRFLKGKNKSYNLNASKYLLDHMRNGKLDFKVSSKCCHFLKKKPALDYERENNIRINISGIRKAEGGLRSVLYKGCVHHNATTNIIHFFPLFHLTDAHMEEIIKDNHIELSKCYTLYGLKRTGCVGCPYGRNWKQELEILRKYEPNKYIACENLFHKSYKLKEGE